MNASDERHRAMRQHATAWRREGLIDVSTEQKLESAFDLPWLSHGVVLQIVFFILASIAVSTFHGFLAVLNLPLAAYVTAVAAIAVAEYLIRFRRWFGTGVEAALWLGGLFAIVGQHAQRGFPHILLVAGAAAAVAGFRVRNPLFGALAAMLVMAYAESRWDLGVVTAMVIASAALLALLRTWERPSTEWLWILLAVLLPLAGRFTADEKWWRVTITIYAVYGAVALILALGRRHHAFFFAAGIGIVIAAIDVARTIAAPAEAKLAACGAFLLGGSYLVAHALRDRRSSLVVTRTRISGEDEAIELAGSLVAADAAQIDPPEQPHVGGGRFGGAGATGEF